VDRFLGPLFCYNERLKLEKEELISLIAPVLTDLGIDLIDVQYVPRRHRSILRVFADETGGIGLDRCAQASRAISDILDRKDAVPGSYVLEVSSPGIDRPLKTKQDFARHVSRWIKVFYYENDQIREIAGRIAKVGDEKLELSTGADENLSIPFTRIHMAKVQVDFKQS
jgi:ribosome maturation factor RimP